MLTTVYNTLKTLDLDAAREFLVSRVNRCDLAMLEGFADFDGLNELAFVIFDVRMARA